MLKKSSLFGVFLVVAIVSGCVSTGTHEKLQKDHEAIQEENIRLKADLLSAGGRITTLDKSLENTSSERDRMAKALAESNLRQSEVDKRMTEYRDLVGKFKALIDSKTLLVKIDKGRMVVGMATDILFPSGSAKLSKPGKAAVANVGKLLASIAGREFQIEGHTDNVPIGSAGFSSNWDLASQRAINVLTVMKEAGVPQERLSAASFGETRPVSPNETAEGRAANRRIEIVVVPDLSGLPGFDELNRMSGEQPQ